MPSWSVEPQLSRSVHPRHRRRRSSRRLRGDARHVAFDRRDQINARRRVIDLRLSQDLGDDHTRSVDTDMELLLASRAASAVFRGGPLAAHHRESRAVDDKVNAFVLSDSTKGEFEGLATPCERR